MPGPVNLFVGTLFRDNSSFACAGIAGPALGHRSKIKRGSLQISGGEVCRGLYRGLGAALDKKGLRD